ncbi:hypothetical protein H6P81_007343 [Aristolochia fimbriata]|uniref:Uncharacterized protein n=1 Tax=Aristolochia fimbriata TaxID=158543 RepID=A0AAV7F0K8_ARIFI|nr:hypothetical protein H6P81_007343 [Aristolochia fimbriata]
MQAHCLDASLQSFGGFRRQSCTTFFNRPVSVSQKGFSMVSCSFGGGKGKPAIGSRKQKGGVKDKKKENVWSIDNDLAKCKEREEKEERERANRRRRRGRRLRDLQKRSKNARVMISGAMLMEVETVLQTQEPVIRPAWSTFASSVSGIWKGVGAVFSPFTAEMEPIGISKQNENLYDCYTLARIEQSSASHQICREVNWVALNSQGERKQLIEGDDNGEWTAASLPSYESFDLKKNEVLEEDTMGIEPGLVFFEDGSYSRGPVEIPVGEYDESKYFLSPTFKFEQCLVKGCHKRLRIVHTIEFNEGGSEIQIIRVAVYEEQWVCPTSLQDLSDDGFDLQPFSQRKRTQPSELTGSWKVFEVSATPIYGEESTADDGKLPYVYLCMETLKKRTLPENPVYFGEEEMLDMQDVTILWLPGGVTGYVDVKKDGVLCIGVGWYSDEGINLVMERDYGTDGKLKEVRWKTEVKRRWPDPMTV